MRYELKSIGIWAFVRVSFFLHLVFGFVIGLFYAALLMMIFAAASAAPLDEFSDFPFDIRAIGPLLMIIMPIAFAFGGAVMGTLFGLLGIAIYNLIGRLMGGLEFELKQSGSDDLEISPAHQAKTDYRPEFIAPPPPPGAGPVKPPLPPTYPAWNPPPPPIEPPRGNDLENP